MLERSGDNLSVKEDKHFLSTEKKSANLSSPTKGRLTGVREKGVSRKGSTEREKKSFPHLLQLTERGRK